MAILKKNQLIGLDIGSHSIKLVEVDHRKKGRILKNFGVIELPHGVIVEGSIKEMETVSLAIKSLIKNLKVRNKNVAASISGLAVIVKKIPLNRQEESKVEATIQEEAEQYIPFDINEVNLDFDILTVPYEAEGSRGGEGAKKSKNYMEVMLAAAKKDVIEEYINVIEIAELNPVILDVDVFALQNVFEISTEVVEPEGCFAMINIGAEQLGINVVSDSVSVFSRSSSYGGFQITKAIMSEFNVSFEEAEKIKLGGSKVDNDDGKLKEIFTSVVSDLIQEIRPALDFVANTYPDKSIEKIIVSGGSCRIPGFQKYLKLEAALPVVEINPFSNLIINEKRFDPVYLKYMAPQAAIAVGLALRSIGDK